MKWTSLLLLSAIAALGALELHKNSSFKFQASSKYNTGVLEDYGNWKGSDLKSVKIDLLGLATLFRLRLE